MLEVDLCRVNFAGIGNFPGGEKIQESRRAFFTVRVKTLSHCLPQFSCFKGSLER